MKTEELLRRLNLNIDQVSNLTGVKINVCVKTHKQRGDNPK